MRDILKYSKINLFNSIILCIFVRNMLIKPFKMLFKDIL